MPNTFHLKKRVETEMVEREIDKSYLNWRRDKRIHQSRRERAETEREGERQSQTNL